MSKKVTKSQVEVYKVKGENMNIAFKNLLQEIDSEDHFLTPMNTEMEEEGINNGEVYKTSEKFYRKYSKNEMSEYQINGTLYNKKPIINDPTRVAMHNIVIKGTKKWETINSFRFDSGEIVEEAPSTKAEALERAATLAVEYNKTINIVVSKRLVGIDGIIGIAEFVPFDTVDDINIYIFWMYKTVIIEQTDEELYEENTEIEENGQMVLKEDLLGYVGRKIIKNS